MKVSVDNDFVILNDAEVLKQYQVSQLEYYGFQKTPEGFIKKIINVESDIKAVLEYLSEQAVVLELSVEIQDIIRYEAERKELINRVFRIARDVKEGTIETASFHNFTNLVHSLPRKLRQHQIMAAYHLYLLKNGANFSVPGSGKTSVVLSVYEKFREEGVCNTLFVIGPPSCFQPWKSEFLETLGRNVNTLILSGGSRVNRKAEYYSSKKNSFELYLCTFHTALNDYLDIIKFISQPGIRAFVVIDEAHYMKQIGGSWAASLLSISKHASAKCILTGTPIPKSYKDVFNLFDFLWGEDSPLDLKSKIEIEILEKKRQDQDIRAILENKIGPLFYRVRKKDLGLIPPIIHPPILVRMNKMEETIYNYVKSKILDLSQIDYLKNEFILSKLWRGRIMRLRQAISYPKLLISTIDDYSEDVIHDSDLKSLILNYDGMEIPGKLQSLTEIVLKLRREKKKVLIWSNFIGTLELIKSHFTLLGEGCELIYGKTPIRKEDSIEVNEEKTREDIRDEFLDTSSGLDILIANPAACAESISLHKSCFHAIYYDLSYNCAQYIQSMDRIHRVGGSETNEAHYYFLQYENTLDQDIKKNLELKAQKMYDVIEQEYAIYDLELSEDSIDDDIHAYKRLFKDKIH